MVIWKEQIVAVPGAQSIGVRARATLLCAHAQGDVISIWFSCDPQAAPEQRSIITVETGATAPERHTSRFLGTCIFHRGAYVLHVFEIIEDIGG